MDSVATFRVTRLLEKGRIDSRCPLASASIGSVPRYTQGGGPRIRCKVSYGEAGSGRDGRHHMVVFPTWAGRIKPASSPWGRPGVFTTEPILHSGNSPNHAKDHGWRGGGKMDPFTQATQAAGARPAEPYAFRMFSADRQTAGLLAAVSFQYGLFRNVRQKSRGDATGVLGLDWARMRKNPPRKQPRECRQHHLRLGRHR